MKVITEKRLLQNYAQHEKAAGRTIGFVPTMGYLHEGHLHLAARARRENDIVIMSIFVNPLQFGPNEDYESYPRSPKGDERKAEDAGVDVLFIPSAEEMYPSASTIGMQVLRRTDVLCGRKRPGHFEGVVTVLSKLFHLALPDRAYFGLKDAQQVAVVDALIHDLDFPIELVPVATVREADGLAKSSRNVYLTAEERELAPFVYKSLIEARSAIEAGERSTKKLAEIVESFLFGNTSMKAEYVQVLSYPELEKQDSISGRIIIAIAVPFSKARLIDNLIVDIQEMGDQPCTVQ